MPRAVKNVANVNDLICMNTLPDATVWRVLSVLPGYRAEVVEASRPDNATQIIDRGTGRPATREQLANALLAVMVLVA